MNAVCRGVAVLYLLHCLPCVAEDIEGIKAEMQAAYKKLGEGVSNATELIAHGQMEEFSQRSQALFPAEERTGAEALLLGNALFRNDPKAAYLLHKEAVAKLPDLPDAHNEWAMEQHRAGEYEGAAKSYAVYLKANPDLSWTNALQAECLLRMGKTEEALAAWKKAEDSQKGSLEHFEKMLCEVHSPRSLAWERAALIAKVKAGDLDAAEELMAFDCAFQRDWWNHGPLSPFLKADLEILGELKDVDAARLNELVCAAKANLANATGEGKAEDILREHGLLLDEKHTLPKSDRLLTPLIAAAEACEGIKAEAAREQWGKAIRERAKASKDAEVHNVLAHLYIGAPEFIEIAQEAWEATGDARFAGSCIAHLAAEKKLTLDHPDLIKARKMHPNHGVIAGLALGQAIEEKQPLESYLLAAIRAEYTELSPSGLFPRRSSRTLRSYFKLLEEQLAEKK
jgi:tetratricopeptide (TPR) repeat protein